MNKIIVVTSGKGGVGKTTLTANLGACLAKAGKKTVLIDTDTGLRNLDLVLGLENHIRYTLVDIVEKKCAPADVILKHPVYDKLSLIPTSQKHDKSAVSGEILVELCKILENFFDYIIIDCPAGIEQGFKTAIAAADTALVVTMPEMAALRDADKIIGELYRADIQNTKLIINRIRPQMVMDGDMLDIDDIQEILGVPIIGEIPDDETIISATNRGQAVIDNHSSLAGRAIQNIADRLLGKDVPFLELKGKDTFYQRFKKFFR